MVEVSEVSYCEFIGDCERRQRIILGMENYCETKQHFDCVGRVKKLYDDKSFVTRWEITQSQITQVPL